MASKNRVEVHVVLTTKYRRRALQGLETTLETSFARAAHGQKWSILAVGVEDGNHAHLALRLHPDLSVSEIVARIKQISTWDLWQSHERHLRQFYWRRDKHLLWGNGYFVDSIGRVPREKVLEFVRKQQ